MGFKIVIFPVLIVITFNCSESYDTSFDTPWVALYHNTSLSYHSWVASPNHADWNNSYSLNYRLPPVELSYNSVKSYYEIIYFIYIMCETKYYFCHEIE